MYRNSEGYPSPVEGYVLSKIAREEKQRAKAQRKTELFRRPLVYVASPYAGNVAHNVQMAKKYCRFVIEQQKNPIASHLLYTRFLNDKNPEEREIGRMYGLALLARCKEVWVFGEYISPGMKAEIDAATKLGKPVRYFTEKMEEKQT